VLECVTPLGLLVCGKVKANGPTYLKKLTGLLTLSFGAKENSKGPTGRHIPAQVAGLRKRHLKIPRIANIPSILYI